MVDAGLDLGKSEPQSLVLLRASDRLAALGYPVFLSASNKRFLWKLLDVEVHEAAEGTMAAHALGIALGCRVLRAHDVRGGPAGRRRDGRGARRGMRPSTSTSDAAEVPVHLVKGDDPVLLGRRRARPRGDAGRRRRPRR